MFVDNKVVLDNRRIESNSGVEDNSIVEGTASFYTGLFKMCLDIFVPRGVLISVGYTESF